MPKNIFSDAVLYVLLIRSTMKEVGELHHWRPATTLPPAKNGTRWTGVIQQKSLGQKQQQNVHRVAAGPTWHAKERINCATSAFKAIIDVIMMTWIVTFTQMEAER